MSDDSPSALPPGAERRYISRFLVLVALLAAGAAEEAASAPVQPAPSAAAIASAVDPVIRRAIGEKGIPGAAFVFVQGDRIVHAQGYGMADREKRVAVDVERTVWPIASVTKLFTGVAALQLVDNGELALEHDINRSLKRISVPSRGYPPITLPLTRDVFVRMDGERLVGFARGAGGRIAVVSGGSWRVADRLPEKSSGERASP